jgi:universal stress protein E
VKILLLIKDMPYDETVVSYGGLIARATQASITLLHVALKQADPATGERILARACEMLPDLAVNTRVRRGDTTGRILAELKDGDYDMVVVGTHRDTILKQYFLGSVAHAVIRRAPASVLVAKQAKPSLKRLLICTGGIEVSELVVKTSARLAEALQAEATLLHVVHSVPSMYTGLSEFEETLPELLQTDTPLARHLRLSAEILAQRGIQAKLQLRRGVTEHEILREVRLREYDLIAMGTTGAAGRVKGWLLTDVTRQVIDQSPISVLVVR